MKRGVNSALLLLAIMLYSSVASAMGITSYSVQGPLEVSFFVGGLPDIVIIHPSNSIYVDNSSIPLLFTVFGQDSMWFNLDNGNNITLLTNSTLFSTSEGSHTLYLYANNSNGTESKKRTFYVNNSQSFIIYENYKGAYKGNSTDFDRFSLKELENLTNMTLEDTRYAKIMWTEAIDLVHHLHPENKIDLDNGTNFSSNRVYVDAGGELSVLNTDAIIWLYGLNFSNPRIMRDGAHCSQSICNILNYSNGTLIFTVTHFAQNVFSAEETPPGGGGGGKGAAAAPGGGAAPSAEVPAPPAEKPIIPPEVCEENWSCGDWGECKMGLQTRKCVDFNQCDTSKNKPSGLKVCPLTTQNIVPIAAGVIILIAVIAAIGAIIAASAMGSAAHYGSLLRLINLAHDALEAGDKKKASALYKALKDNLLRQRKHLTRSQYHRLHGKGLDLYEKISKRPAPQ